MAYGKGYGGKMPNDSKGGDGKATKPAGASNSGPNSGLKKSNEMRGDMTKKPSDHNPYPHGLA